MVAVLDIEEEVVMLVEDGPQDHGACFVELLRVVSETSRDLVTAVEWVRLEEIEVHDSQDLVVAEEDLAA